MRVDLDNRPDILGVLVDGKAIPNATHFDLEAGYVEVEVPTVPSLDTQETGSFEVEDEEVKWETKKLFGKVQLAVRKK